MSNTEYHCHDSCNKCAGLNDVKVTDSLDGHPLEYETKCKECGHEDHWCTGFFLSSEYMESNCKKYSFKRKGNK